MDELQKLEHLSLVSKLCTELDNHLGINDKDLAEFIIELEAKNPTFEGFRKALVENGAEFPDSLISNLQRIIKLMKPSSAKKDGKSLDDEVSEGVGAGGKKDKKTEQLAMMFPGLALANDKFSKVDAPSSEEDNDSELDEKKEKKNIKEAELEAVDAAMLELEALAPGFETKVSKSERDVKRKSRSRSKSRERHRGSDKDRKRDKSRERHRDRETERSSGKDRHRDRDRDRRSRSRSRERHRRSRSRSRESSRRHRRSRSRSRDRRRRSKSRERNRRSRSRSRDRSRRSRSRSRDRSSRKRRSRCQADPRVILKIV